VEGPRFDENLPFRAYESHTLVQQYGDIYVSAMLASESEVIAPDVHVVFVFLEEILLVTFASLLWRDTIYNAWPSLHSLRSEVKSATGPPGATMWHLIAFCKSKVA
jgi:hypothetical protein